MHGKKIFQKKMYSKKVYSKKMYRKKMYSKKMYCKKMYRKKMYSKKVYCKKMYSKKVYCKNKRCSQAELSMERSARVIKDRCVTPTISMKSIPSQMRRIKGLDTTTRCILRQRNRTAARYKKTNWRP